MVLRHRPVMLALFVGGARGDGAHVQRRAEGLHPRSGQRLAVRQPARRPGHVVLRHGRSGAEQVADIIIRNPYVDSFMATTGGGGGGSAEQLRGMHGAAACRAPSGQQPAQQMAQQLAAAARSASPASAACHRLPPALQIGGRQGNQNYSLMMQSLNTDELYAWAPQLEAAITRELPEVQDVSTDLEMKSPRDQPDDRPRQGGGGRPERHRRSQNALYDGLGPKLVVDHLRRRPASTACCSSWIRSISSRPIRCEDLRSRRRPARWCRSNRWSTSRRPSARRSINHSGQLPSVSISFGLRPGRVARRRPPTHVKQVADAAAAGDDHHQLRGLGQGVPGSR